MKLILKRSISFSIFMLLVASYGQLGLGSGRNAYPVKNAFRDVVEDAARSTVRVLCDGKRSSLGAVVAGDGYILTKASELDGDIRCQLYDGTVKDAEIVGADERWDLALLRIDAEDLPEVTWSADDTPAVGSWLATTGLETIPVSIGVVSVAARKIDRRLPALGVVLEDSDQGPRVHRVVPDSQAQKAGIRQGDIIRQLDGENVESRDALIAAIREHRPGDAVRLGIRRAGKDSSLNATLGEWAQLVHGERESFQNTLGGRLSERRAGFPIAIQHDTVLRPDQCGGPIVDLDGRVVGLNIARASRVGSYAIPASSIKSLLDDLKAGKMVTATQTD